MLAADLAPSAKNIRRTLGQALGDDHAPARARERQRAFDIWRQRRGLGLLDLEKQRVVVVDALQQQHAALRHVDIVKAELGAAGVTVGQLPGADHEAAP